MPFVVIPSAPRNPSYVFSRLRHRAHLLLCPTAFAIVLAFLATPARATIRYDVSIANPAKHQFHVTMTIPAVQNNVLVQMPAWDALYQIRDFADRVTNFRASDAAGNSLAVRRIDKQTWRIELSLGPNDANNAGSSAAGGNEVRVQYAIFWDDPGPFDTQLNSEHAFINLAMILPYLPERRGEDDVVHFAGVPQDWRVAVELPGAEPANTASNAASSTGGGAEFTAPNYDALVDAPVEIGQFDDWTFPGAGKAAGKTIRVVYHGIAVDHALLTKMLSEIVAYETTLMGEAPFPEYTFFLHVGPNVGGGGMEHSNCTAISVSSFGELANVSAHEFFHLWNVKRIRPQSLEPIDHTTEMYTRALWFAEGVTSTYAAFTLVRTGLWTHAQFLADLAAQINELESRPAHKWQSAEESSLDTWFDKYPLYNRPEFSISYYNKGQLLGLALDILIRDATDNRASLDDVLRRMNREYAERGRFYDDSAGVEAAIEETVRAANSGEAPAAASEAGAKSDAGAASTEFADFFRRYVSGTDEIPFADLLARAGLTLATLQQNRMPTGAQAQPVYYVQEMLNPTPRQLRIRTGLFSGTTDAGQH